MDGGAFTQIPAVVLEELGITSSNNERDLSAETRRALEELEAVVEESVVPALRSSNDPSARHLGLTIDAWRHLKSRRMAFVSSLAEDLAVSSKLQREFREAYRRGPDDLVARIVKRDPRSREALSRIGRVMRATATDLQGLGDVLDAERSQSVGWMLGGHHLFRDVIDAATALDAVLVAVSLDTRAPRSSFPKSRWSTLLAVIECAARQHQDAVGQLVVVFLDQQGRPVDVTQMGPMFLPPGTTNALDDASPLPPGAREWVHAVR